KPVTLEEVQQVEWNEPHLRRPRKTVRRRRPREDDREERERRLARRVIWFGVIAAILVFILLAALVGQNIIKKPRHDEHNMPAAPTLTPRRIGYSTNLGRSTRGDARCQANPTATSWKWCRYRT